MICLQNSTIFFQDFQSSANTILAFVLHAMMVSPGRFANSHLLQSYLACRNLSSTARAQDKWNSNEQLAAQTLETFIFSVCAEKIAGREPGFTLNRHIWTPSGGSLRTTSQSYLFLTRPKIHYLQEFWVARISSHSASHLKAQSIESFEYLLQS